MDDKVKYWIDLSLYDLETAKSLLETQRWLYVGFMCHQTIEKALKAYWQSSLKQVPPKTHNVSYLAEKSSLLDELSETDRELLVELEPLNVEIRYPVHRDILMKKINEEFSRYIYMKTKDLYEWIKKKL